MDTRRMEQPKAAGPALGWMSGSHRKRRPTRAELTADMISPPLGDFRHTMHVGRGGDVFGDTSFLSNHGGVGRGGGRSPRSFLLRTLQQVRRGGPPSRGSTSSAASSPDPPAISPIIKNAVSLPQLHQAGYDSMVVSKLSFRDSPRGSPDGHHGYGLESGFCTIPRLLPSEKPLDKDSSFPSESELPRSDSEPELHRSDSEPKLHRSDSMLSFRLDLGPSLLSELLSAMSLSEGPGKEPAPTTDPQPPAAEPRPQGRCPNGVSAAKSPPGEKPGILPAEKPRPPAGLNPARGQWVGSWGPRPHYSEVTARQELAGVLPQSRASWESQDEGLGLSPCWARGSSEREPRRAPVPSTVQASSFQFADEDDEVNM
ncbi:cdc42 effector protein 1 [Monodelphis domestica]|uniref:CDC42 effector protein 1 n=1 Tax=Monodelphis domestica TaxID=13616 RepID=F6XMH9_MONDO|nr:cdc42 effector protein 1 [Monodelphis domestica]XP_056654879.1 cdc42 effector protein 1 [Monodelphis domestica]